MLWDHPYVYAYGRRSLDSSDAAVVVINRSTQAQSITLNLSGYLPNTSALVDVLHNNTQYFIASNGSLTIPTVPAMSGVLLVLSSGDITPPTAPSNLISVAGESQVSLTWSEVSEASSYQVYRSLLSGGGYEQIGTTTSESYTDTGVINGTQYYYVVRAAKLLGVISEFSNEATALPHWNIDWANLQSPAEITHIIGLTPTQNVYGQLFIDDISITPGATDGILAQVGYGSVGIPPAEWSTWRDATFDSNQGENDQFAGPLLPEFIGDFQVVFRYSSTNGQDWVYADLNGTFEDVPSNPGILHVLPAADITSPSTPANLTLVDWGDHFASMAWDPLPEDPTFYAYDIYRSTDINASGDQIDRVLSPTTFYTDTQVTSGSTYYYRIQAIDASFNRSGYSNQITATPLTRQVSVTFNVDVPVGTLVKS